MYMQDEVGSRWSDEAELVRRAQAGDETAFGMLIDRHQGIALRTATLMAGNASDAEDATQTAFVKAFFALGRFRPGAPFRPWLLRIVVNEARNQRRSGARRASLALRAFEAGRATDVSAPSAERTLLERERAHSLVDALNELPDRERDVLVCRYLLGLTEQETAAALKLRLATVRSRRTRALKRLRTQLGADDD